MLEAAGIFFEVGAPDADLPAVALDGDRQAALGADRGVVLGDLEVLREVGVVVVLPVEPGLLGDVGVERLSDLDGGLDGRLVDDGERARQPQAGRAGPSVRLLVVGRLGRTPAEDLRVRLELDVDLQADDGNEVSLRERLRGHYVGVRRTAAKA